MQKHWIVQRATSHAFAQCLFDIEQIVKLKIFVLFMDNAHQ